LVLEQYIQEVLYRQRSCSLPKIGTFRVQHTPARYDVTSNTIEAPGEKVVFEDTWVDDGRCAEWIAHKEHLMVSIARLKMDKYIEEFKAALQTGNPVRIPGIGQLQSNTLGMLSFTPEALPITMDTLHVKPVIRTDASHKITVGDKEFVGQQVTNHLTAAADQSAAPIMDYPDYPETPSGFRWWWIIAPVGAILFAVLVWWLAEQQDKAAVEAAAVDAPAAVDTTMMKQETDSVNTAETPVANDTIEYYAVLDTYRDSARAARRYEQRRKSFGQTEVQIYYRAADSGVFKVVHPIRSLRADTTFWRDSIRRFYKTKITLQY
jgi:nucleoid DNA-binding protein